MIIYGMQFELTNALIDHILFCMEDQEGEFYLDTVEGVVAGGFEGLDFYLDENPEIDRDDETRFISLPEWDSADGFRLMESFATKLRNPMIREGLTSALSHGRGVFRAFKNVLSRHPETEKLWFSYKEREMRREVITWYNGLREELGLEKIGMEPEETSDLVLEDFRFRPFANEDLDKAKELHGLCLEEHKKILPEKGVKKSAETLIRESLVFQNSLKNIFDNGPAETIHAMTAETGGGEFAGYISGLLEGSILYIQNLEVKDEYRGLGVGEALLQSFLERFSTDDTDQILLDLPSWIEGFSRVLSREGFQPYTVRYRLDPRDRQG